MADREVTYADIEAAAIARDPQLPDLVSAYMLQADPPEDRPEGADEAAITLARDSWTMTRVRNETASWKFWGKSEDEKRGIRQNAWRNLMQAPHPPPRLRLAELLPRLYEEDDEPGRQLLMETFARARLGWGLWKAMKTVYKRAEERHDAAMFGVIAYRLDAGSRTPINHQEVGRGTIIYMRRRAWRWLRHLASSLPELYPDFVVEVMRHYPHGHTFYDSWIANHVWDHSSMYGQSKSSYVYAPSSDVKRRAFDAAWRLSPDPLLRLLEDAENGLVCKFAIQGLEAAFPDELRNLDPVAIARLGRKPAGAVHEWIVGLLETTPNFHPARLAQLGLREMVLSFLTSPSDAAAAYAVGYANAHAPDLPVERLLEVLTDGRPAASKFALSRLEKIDARAIGLSKLLRLFEKNRSAWPLAQTKLAEFRPAEVDVVDYVWAMTGPYDAKNFLEGWFRKENHSVPTGHLRAYATSPKIQSWARHQALQELGKRPAAEIGVDWIKNALLDPNYRDSVARWLTAGVLRGPDLDVEWMKGLAMRPMLRQTALRVLGNRKLVEPSRIGLGWLLAMARQADPQLHEFAHQYLLMYFGPTEFAEGGATEHGLDRIWGLAAGPNEPEPVRMFGGTYLRLHHPKIGPTLPESRSLGVEPKLGPEAYSPDRVVPLFDDERPDVRKLAAAIGRVELPRWGDPALAYRLAASRFREARSVGAAALLAIGDPDATPVLDPQTWLSARDVFALAESPHKGAREVALTMIRRHYDALGGAKRLAWLMESPDREVRLFAVRLLWEKHRPRHGSAGGDHGRFEDVAALRSFLRGVLFGLPPGRMERRDRSDDAVPDRPLPASVAKGRLVDVVRDFALESREFAALALPVLGEFMHSEATGEWQACVVALAQIRRAHPDLPSPLPEPRPVDATSSREASA